MRSLLSYLSTLLLVVILNFTGTFAQTVGDRVISGVVTDENNEPLPGAGVMTSDGKRGTVTDANGKYSIDLSKDHAVLSFSFLGYETQDIVVTGEFCHLEQKFQIHHVVYNYREVPFAKVP